MSIAFDYQRNYKLILKSYITGFFLSSSNAFNRTKQLNFLEVNIDCTFKEILKVSFTLYIKLA